MCDNKVWIVDCCDGSNGSAHGHADYTRELVYNILATLKKVEVVLCNVYADDFEQEDKSHPRRDLYISKNVRRRHPPGPTPRTVGMQYCYRTNMFCCSVHSIPDMIYVAFFFLSSIK